MINDLTFNTLREANVARLPQFKNSKGEPAHEKPDGSDWSLAEWMNAVAGELGEAANIIKKIRRGDMSLEEARPMLADEFADIVTYLDITAMQAGVNLGIATIEKFNRVSNRVGSTIRIDDASQEEIIIDLSAMRADKSEGSYYYSWQANIAMAFKDEYERLNPNMRDGNKEILHRIANNAAKNFLDTLLSTKGKP